MVTVVPAAAQTLTPPGGRRDGDDDGAGPCLPLGPFHRATPRATTPSTSPGPYGMRILDAIRSIYDQQDDNLAFQYACRIGRCGTCAVRVNGRPVLACQERARSEMTIEPLAGFPVIRDLVVDRTDIERRYAALQLVPDSAVPHSGEPEPIDPSTQRDVGLMGSCIACMICVSGCPAVRIVRSTAR